MRLLVGLYEQMTAHAGRRIWKMVPPVLVAVEAAISFRLFFAMLGMAVAAPAMLRRRVQPRKTRRLMAATAGRRSRGTLGAVGAMTVATVGREFAVGRVGYLSVTAGAGSIVGLAAMGLMALGTLLVTLGRARMLVFMATLALFLQGAAVGFVAVLAIGVPTVGLLVLLLVAGLTIDFERRGAMGQTAVAVRTRRVPR